MIHIISYLTVTYWLLIVLPNISGTSVLALTASADWEFRVRVMKQLQMDNPTTLALSPNRKTSDLV